MHERAVRWQAAAVAKKKREKEATPQRLRCSFCEGTQADVKQLIAGVSGDICDFCVGVAHGIVTERAGDARDDRIARRQDAMQGWRASWRSSSRRTVRWT